MRKIIKITIIVALSFALLWLALIHLLIPALVRAHHNTPKSPVDYNLLGTVWVCENPYVWFESSDDDWGYTGIGEVETASGKRMPVRFFMDRGTFFVYPESAFLDIEEYEDPYLRYPTEPCIMHGIYKMNRKGTKVTLSISEDEIYDYQYDTMTFYRQDPAGTEESAAQP